MRPTRGWPRRGLLLALGLCVFFAATVLRADPRQTFDIVDLADGVFAAVEKHRIFGLFRSNAMVVIGDEAVLVVDSDGWPSRAEAVIEEIERRTDLPVRYLVNTHYGPDHVRGNQLYAERFPGLVILASAATDREIAEKGPKLVEEEIESRVVSRVERAREQLATGVDDEGTELSERRKRELEAAVEHHAAYLEDLGKLILRRPDVIVGDSLTIELGSRRVDLHLFRGHSEGDLVVHLPEEKILAAGDLVDGERPFTTLTSVADHRKSLDELARLSFQTLVPGHGLVQKDRQELELARALLRELERQVASSVSRGLGKAEAVEALDLGDYRESWVAPRPDLERVFDIVAERTAATAYQELAESRVEEASRGPFDWTLGRWSGFREDAASGQRATMWMVVEGVLGGQGQSRELEVEGAEGSYRGHAVQVLDPRSGRWVRQYVNATRGTFSRLEGEVTGSRSVWRSTPGDRSRESRLTSERIGTDRWRRTMSLSTDGGETWQDLWVDELHRSP